MENKNEMNGQDARSSCDEKEKLNRKPWPNFSLTIGWIQINASGGNTKQTIVLHAILMNEPKKKNKQTNTFPDTLKWV